MTDRIVILEDDARRRAEMRRVLKAAELGEPAFAVTAGDFVKLMCEPARPVLISLDHDLEPPAFDGSADDQPGAIVTIDPGTGRDAAEFLVTREPACPVIIHSTNHPAALAMEDMLAECGWKVERMMPYADLDWRNVAAGGPVLAASGSKGIVR